VRQPVDIDRVTSALAVGPSTAAARPGALRDDTESFKLLDDKGDMVS
jgi:hypothetical protein